MIIIGIDPGLDGAIAVRDGAIIELFDTPTLTTQSGKKKKTDLKGQKNYLGN